MRENIRKKLKKSSREKLRINSSKSEKSDCVFKRLYSSSFSHPAYMIHNKLVHRFMDWYRKSYSSSRKFCYFSKLSNSLKWGGEGI